MPHVRLVADDLTGALDGAAQLTGLYGPIAVPLHDVLPAGSWALDSETRDGPSEMAAAKLRRLAPMLRPRPGDIAFLKLDSLLRGHAGREIGAVAAALPGIACVIAPAFPYQGRVTRGGRQWLCGGDTPIGEDLAATLRDCGLQVALRRPGETVPDGISLWDAEHDAELDRIVASGWARSVPPLWCGTAGLAGALARHQNAAAQPAPPIQAPVLGLIGSDHAVSRAQLQAVAAIAIGDAGPANVAAVSERLAKGAAVVCFALPNGLGRAEAANQIAAMLRELADRLPRPGSIIASGGATLRALCFALGAQRLDVVGQCEPGIPASILRGGRWDGVPVVSKSGAFGPPDLLVRLISPFLVDSRT